jgi:hypothetical protein
MLVADAPPAATSAPESDVASSSVAPSDVAASDSPSSDPLATGAPMPDGTPRPRRRRTLKAGETEAATKSGETEA